MEETRKTVSTEKRLARYLRSPRIHPALLFSGPGAASKREAITRLAALFLCAQPKKGDAGCGRCQSCRKVAAGVHPDLLWVRTPDGEEAEPIKIETVREVLLSFETAPHEATHKIAIFDEAHRLTESAANALLKGLEEPAPGRVYWLLSTQARSLLGTIRSRSLEFRFPPEGAVQDEASPEETKTFADATAKAWKDRSPYPVLDVLGSAATGHGTAERYVRWLLGSLRAAAVDEAPKGAPFADLPKTAVLDAFDDAVTLEEKLRSNANFGLLVGSYLRTQVEQ